MRDHALQALPSGADGNVRWSGTKGPGTCVTVAGPCGRAGMTRAGEEADCGTEQEKQSCLLICFNVCLFF